MLPSWHPAAYCYKNGSKVRQDAGTELHGEAEKVPRFLNQFPEAEIEQFYSNSLTDVTLVELAGEAFSVRNEEIFPREGNIS